MRLRHDARKNSSFAYVDEAGTSQRFFACGVLVHGPLVSGKDDERLNEHIRMLKVEAGIRLRGDVCWKKTPKPGKYLNLYLRYIEGFFRHPRLSFNAIVVDTHKYPLDSKTFFAGSKDVGIDVFAFHLIEKRIVRFWTGGTRLHIRYDRRSRPREAYLAKLTSRLRQSEIYSENKPSALIIRGRSVTGGRHSLLQVADVLLGCVVAPLNSALKHDGKLQLSDSVRSHLGRDPTEPTPPSEKKFNVWRFEAV